MSAHVHFVGPLLPHKKAKTGQPWYDARLSSYKKVVLATQGTVERDINKLIVPTLEAFKDTDTLVVVTTGGSQTAELRQKYPQQNIIIEDFIAFDEIMPYADVYVTNGGYGGVLLSIQNRLPMVAAGVHEGKIEICARIGYFRLGLNLKTELPTVDQIRSSVNTVLNDPSFKKNVDHLADEFATYDTYALATKHMAKLLKQAAQKQVKRAEEVPIY
jgi:UDP:flavonoid glycosyltransferase YjiC (YdhE family)